VEPGRVHRQRVEYVALDVIGEALTACDFDYATKHVGRIAVGEACAGLVEQRCGGDAARELAVLATAVTPPRG
jgi:hypothetical protein